MPSLAQAIVWIIVGLLGGSLAALMITRERKGFGILRNLGIGLVGALVGGQLFRMFGIFPGLDSVAVSLRMSSPRLPDHCSSLLGSGYGSASGNHCDRNRGEAEADRYSPCGQEVIETAGACLQNMPRVCGGFCRPRKANSPHDHPFDQRGRSPSDHPRPRQSAIGISPKHRSAQAWIAAKAADGGCVSKVEIALRLGKHRPSVYRALASG
jgi:uncharacterized membrane protein YeaQ/YmgE (transglycosylase-associated protein family)